MGYAHADREHGRGDDIYTVPKVGGAKDRSDKSRKVINDVVKTMFNEKFVAELFKPHELYTNSATRDIFDRLAHSSIMRLNKNSMDKLYDLMTMGFKYQMLQCTSPDQLVQVTLNHLESVRQFVEGDAEEAVDAVIRRVNEVYSSFTPDQFHWLRRTIARFYQNRKVKISMFLANGYQETDGTIKLPLSGHLPEGTPMPGKVEKYRADGTTVKYSVDLAVLRAHKLKPYKSHRVNLGSNMYAKEGGGSLIKSGSSPNVAREGKQSGEPVAAAASESKENAAKEMSMLASLICPAPLREDDANDDTFRLNLFPDNSLFFGADDSDDSAAGVPKLSRSVNINGKADRKSVSTRMAELGFDDDCEMRDAGASKEPDDDYDDLLDLMDEAEGKF